MSKGADDDKLRAKDYDDALEKLHGELVKLQQWVVHKGLKICIVFEGRDGAGKFTDPASRLRIRRASGRCARTHCAS